MKKAKNIFLLSGICLYVLKTLADISIRIYYIFIGGFRMSDIAEIPLLFLPIILYMSLPTILLVLNLKNKHIKSFSIVVTIFSALSLVLVDSYYSPILTYFIMSKMGLVDWFYTISAFFPNYGIVSLISFILITIGSIMSCKKS